jgi:hypothetical protein
VITFVALICVTLAGLLSAPQHVDG